MKDLCCDLLPDERIRVFISSAQNEENGFQWEPLRRRIKETLKSCPFLSPFIIEDSPSELPSTQRFMQQVIRSNIVVLLIKNELRFGTETEFITAEKYRKPMLVYFLGDKENDKVEKLRRYIQKNDLCTYCGKYTVGPELDRAIYKHVIENIIEYYLATHTQAEPVNETVDIVISNSKLEESVFSRKETSRFFGFMPHLGKLLDIHLSRNQSPPSGELCFIMDAALDWLIAGAGLDKTLHGTKLVEYYQNLQPDNTWYSHRLNAIFYALDGNLTAALNEERKALDILKDNTSLAWLVQDILIDCRTFEMLSLQETHQWSFTTEAQKQLDLSQTIPYLPVADRYLKTAFQDMLAEEIKLKTASRYTTFFGTNLGKALSNVANYFLSSLLYGSYTHMLLSRNETALLLYKYAHIGDDGNLAYQAVKLFMLAGDQKTFKQVLLHDWNLLYPFVTANADSLWEMCREQVRWYKNETTLTFLSILGLYMSESRYEEAAIYIYSLCREVTADIADIYFECMIQNISRLNHDAVARSLAYIIQNEKYILGNTITSLIFELDLAKVSSEVKAKLNEALSHEISRIVERNGDPQVIAALVKNAPTFFSELEPFASNSLSSTQKILYNVNLGKDSWENLLKSEINIARMQLDKNKSSIQFTVYSENPYRLIKMIAIQHNSAENQAICNTEFFPLCCEVLVSNTAIPTKDDCISALCEILAFYKSKKIPINDLLRQTLTEYIAENEQEFVFMSHKSKKSLVFKAFFLKMLIDKVDKESFIQMLFSYNNQSDDVRETISMCIEVFLRYEKTIDKTSLAMIEGTILQCFNDSVDSIRVAACTCIAHILGYCEQADFFEEKLCEAAIDPSTHVRQHLIELCHGNQISRYLLKRRIIGILADDSCYSVRQNARSILMSC